MAIIARFLKSLLVPITILVTCGRTSAQDYSIYSLQGSIAKIHVEPQYVNNLLKIIYSTDTICVGNFTDFDEDIRVLNKRFLKITYKVRTGSGIKERNTVLLCVNDNSLCQALHVLSFSSSIFDKTHDRYTDSLQLFEERSIYSARLSFVSSKEKECDLSFAIHDETSRNGGL